MLLINESLISNKNLQKFPSKLILEIKNFLQALLFVKTAKNKNLESIESEYLRLYPCLFS